MKSGDETNRRVALSTLMDLLHPSRSETEDSDSVFLLSRGPAHGDQVPSLRRASCSVDSLGDDLSQDSNDDELASSSSPVVDDEMRAEDPFLYYSSDKRRMEHLLDVELPHIADEEPTVRKTRISFEVDPMLSLMSSFPELFDELENEA